MVNNIIYYLWWMVYNTIILYKVSKSNTLTITIDQIKIDKWVFGYTYTTKEGVFWRISQISPFAQTLVGVRGKTKNLKHKPLSIGTKFWGTVLIKE